MTLQEYFKNPDFLFDSHCHLNDNCFADIVEQKVINSQKEDVRWIFDMPVDINSSLKSLALSKKFDGIKSFVGIDPEIFMPGSELYSENIDINELTESLNQVFIENNDQIFGIGESGMDDYWTKELNSEDRNKSLKKQEELFRFHLELGQKFKKPLSIHSRAAEELCLEIVKNYDSFGIFHSFTGGYETAKKILDAGWGLGVNGIITFKNANDLREVYKKILGKLPNHITPEFFYSKNIYFETDSPYLSPEGKRGEQNEPANINKIYNFIINNL